MTAAPFGGGVSNVVVAARTGSGGGTDDAGERYVLKQPLANLDVEDDWPADTVRLHNEAAAARTFEEVLAGESPITDDSWSRNGRATVPAVIDEDERDHVVVLGAAPESARTWKTELLAGNVATTVAEIVGRTLGRVHAAVAGHDAVRNRIGDRTPFVQFRIDPYHRTVANRHPALAEPIEAEIDRILSVDRTLAHGDYSPKNVVVDRSGDAPTVWLIDFEVAHWGDPAFDPAFLLSHLFIKSLYNREQQSRYLDATRSFWDAYDSAVEWDVEGDVVRELRDAVTAILVKPNQTVTVSRTLDVVDRAQEASVAPIVSARSGETCDSTVADLAVGTAADRIKIGSLVRSERLSKYNRLSKIARNRSGCIAPLDSRHGDTRPAWSGRDVSSLAM